MRAKRRNIAATVIEAFAGWLFLKAAWAIPVAIATLDGVGPSHTFVWIAYGIAWLFAIGGPVAGVAAVAGGRLIRPIPWWRMILHPIAGAAAFTALGWLAAVGGT